MVEAKVEAMEATRPMNKVAAVKQAARSEGGASAQRIIAGSGSSTQGPEVSVGCLGGCCGGW